MHSMKTCQEGVRKAFANSHRNAKARWPGSHLRGMGDFITALPRVIHLVMWGPSSISMCGLTGERRWEWPPRPPTAEWTLTSVPFLFRHSFNKYVPSFYSGLGSRLPAPSHPGKLIKKRWEIFWVSVPIPLPSVLWGPSARRHVCARMDANQRGALQICLPFRRSKEQCPRVEELKSYLKVCNHYMCNTPSLMGLKMHPSGGMLWSVTRDPGSGGQTSLVRQGLSMELTAPSL